MSNLDLWNAVSKTDPEKTKKVNQRGGFTAIDSYYTIKRLTEQFGPLGKGWGGEVSYEFHEGCVVCFAEFWHMDGETRCHAPAIMTSNVMFTGDADKKRIDEDAGKKALTDAITKWASYLGFSADVFEGKFDDNRYVADLKHEIQQEKMPKSPFANAALRNKFQDNVTKSYNECFSITELRTIAELNKAKFDELKDGGNQYDLLLLDELRKQYAMAKARIAQDQNIVDSFGQGFANTPVSEDEIQY